jgi:hypothetical protein
MTAQENIEIMDVPAGRRQELDWILEESFEGWYLWHSKKTLRDVELVRAAMSSGRPLGLVMLKSLEGKLLLENALQLFKASDLKEVFASVEKENEPSEALFASEGFTKTSFGEVSKRHGSLHAANMYRAMTVVPGEILLRKPIL